MSGSGTPPGCAASSRPWSSRPPFPRSPSSSALRPASPRATSPPRARRAASGGGWPAEPSRSTRCHSRPRAHLGASSLGVLHLGSPAGLQELREGRRRPASFGFLVLSLIHI
eukprot:7508268-Alexandrium_andersonii.AAC.1